MSTSSQPEIAYCPNCGQANGSWRSSCKNCQTNLPKPEVTARRIYKRPQFVTIYLGLIVISNITATFRIVFEQPPFILFALIFALVVGQMVGVIGVWQMQNWGRVALMISLGATIIFVCSNIFLARLTPELIGNSIRVLLNIIFVWWLSDNKRLFKD